MIESKAGYADIVVVGLGYVGLPLAVALADHFTVVGFDTDPGRVAQLGRGEDRTREVDSERLARSPLRFTAAAGDCAGAALYIVTVPTPVDKANRPDLGPLLAATRSVAQLIDGDRPATIVFESTVYPGVTEEICGPEIERLSGLKRGHGFKLGYSPERINPGDRQHRIETIIKVIAGEDADTVELLAAVYGAVTSAGVFRAASIKAAEAAKVIENAQRDINIAFMNEITQIFARLDLSIWDVLAAARTKWNFLPFEPGLVGGHCIGVDPYYLSHRAQELGHRPQVILAGRETNDGMGGWVADRLHERRGGRAGTALVLGLTFKEDVPDLRNSKVVDIVKRLQWLGHSVSVADPLADPATARHEYGVSLCDPEGQHDMVIGAVAHASYRSMEPARLQALVRPGGIIADLRGMWRASAFSGDVTYWSL